MVDETREKRMRILTRAEMEAVMPPVDPQDIEAENRRQYCYALTKEVAALLPPGWGVAPDASDGPALLFNHEASLEAFRVLLPVNDRTGRTVHTHAIRILGQFIARLTAQILEYERCCDREE